MKIGIIGPAQSGKTTMFKVLLQSDTNADIGVFKVMDSRLEKLAQLFSAKKITHPEFTFLDLQSTGDFSSKNNSKLQDIDLFVCVIGSFFSDDPKKDLEEYLTNIILADLEAMQNRVARIEKDRMKIKTDVEAELKLLNKCQDLLSEYKLLSKAGLSKEEIKLFSGFEYITLRPMIVVINVSDEPDETKVKQAEEYCMSRGLSSIRFYGKTECEALELSKPEQEQFLKEMGEGYNFREKLSRLITEKLNLIIFFTAGEKDTRGWHLEAGLPALEAAGKIHSDIKRGFIRAEVYSYDDLIKYDSDFHKVREAGLLRIEGKEYIVKDGDVLNIRFNV